LSEHPVAAIEAIDAVVTTTAMLNTIQAAGMTVRAEVEA
jgi:hypothetical protein